jgi:hypothetical protein
MHAYFEEAVAAPREARNAGVRQLRPLLRDISQLLKESVIKKA